MSLVLRYKFDESTELLTTDSSGNSNTLVNGGGVVSVTDATYRDVAYFDGVNSPLTLGTPPSSMTGTVHRTFSFWMKRDNQDLEIFHGQGLGVGDELRVQFQGGVRLYNNGQLQNITTQSFTTDTWYNIGFAYDGTTQNVYVNGVSIGSTSVSMITSPGDASVIGGSPRWPDSFLFTGSMSDFRIYDYALTPEINEY
ncbi:unnamed protein product [Ectocarpus sp. 12 AP-2014]